MNARNMQRREINILSRTEQLVGLICKIMSDVAGTCDCKFQERKTVHFI